MTGEKPSRARWAGGAREAVSSANRPAVGLLVRLDDREALAGPRPSDSVSGFSRRARVRG